MTTNFRIGLVGGGIGGSLSPALHETEARAVGLTDYRYELLDIEMLGRRPDESGTVVREAVAAGYTGFNITHPCKQTVIDGLDVLDSRAAAMGAVNTVAVDGAGRLVGYNTDYTGFAAALARNLNGATLNRVVLCGAGGAGSAVAHALAGAGVRQLTIGDVDEARAVGLADEVTRRYAATRAEGVGSAGVAAAVGPADGVVNASPIGMDGHPGTPFDPAALHRGVWVADIVYRPVRTALLAAAAALGCRTLDGAQMLVAQAADTFALLTRTEPDRDRMRAHLTRVLAERAGALA
jgi:shikimate dehydrogenase